VVEILEFETSMLHNQIRTLLLSCMIKSMALGILIVSNCWH